jgi:hypothetical protein
VVVGDQTPCRRTDDRADAEEEDRGAEPGRRPVAEQFVARHGEQPRDRHEGRAVDDRGEHDQGRFSRRDADQRDCDAVRREEHDMGEA